MRTIVITDIHGCYEEFVELLEVLEYKRGVDRLVLMGDYIDRGKQSLQVLELVMELSEVENVIVLGGNHEDMFLSWLDNPIFEREDIYFQNGGLKTVENFCKPYGVYGKTARTKQIIKRYYQKHIEFIRNLPDYFEDEKHIFVHAGVNLVYADWKNSSKQEFRWIRDMFWFQPNETGKKIIFGHTPTWFLHSDARLGEPKESHDVWMSKNKDRMCLDGGCVFGGKLHALEIDHDTGEYYIHSVEKHK